MSDAERLEAALSTSNPASAVRTIAVELSDAGIPQAQLLKLFDDARERHSADGDGRCYDALLDAMDYIAGWCSPVNRLYQPPSSD